MRIVIYGNEYQEDHLADLEKLFSTLQKYNSWIEIEKSFYDYLCTVMPSPPAINDVVKENENFSAAIALSIGGDGTFLRTAQWVSSKGIPILGINTGSLGYLAEVSVSDIEEVIDEIFNEKYNIASRTMIHINTSADIKIKHPYALNEVAISKEETSSMIKMETEVNNTYLTTYMGDGLLISTPTGSTAYNLSVGGPILEPNSRCLVLSPIAAHSLTMRPLILNDNSIIKVTTHSRSNSYRMSIDGRSYVLPASSSITLQKAPFCVKVIQRRNHHFASTLRNKLMWGIDKR